MFELTKNIQHAVRKGDRKTVLELYHNTFQLLMGNAVRYSNDKEKQMQIVNNAFMKIVSNIEKFKIGTSYFSWAKQIVNREIIDDFRKTKRYDELFVFQEEYHENQFENEPFFEVDKKIEAEELQAMVDKLPPATKMVFNLFAIDDYSYKEISENLDVSYETVKWHIKEARKRLKQEIENLNYLKRVSG